MQIISKVIKSVFSNGAYKANSRRLSPSMWLVGIACTSSTLGVVKSGVAIVNGNTLLFMVCCNVMHYDGDEATTTTTH